MHESKLGTVVFIISVVVMKMVPQQGFLIG